MTRMLYSDIRKILTHLGFRICLLVNVFYQLLSVILLKIIAVFFMHSNIDSDTVSFMYGGIAAFLVTASTLLTTTCEFTDGCLRNKLISGVKRYEVILSAMLGGIFQGFVHSAVACITATLTNVIFTTGFSNFTVPEIAEYWLVITFACMAIGAFTTVLIMVLGGGKSSYVVGLVIAITMKIMSMEILDKLYPEKGHVSITGRKLAAYTFVDKYVPYLHLQARPHFSFDHYVLGCLGLILISTLAGIIIFNRKEIV